MIVDITGIGWVTAAGSGCAKDHLTFDMPDGKLPGIAPKSVFDEPYPYFRRMDEYSRLGLAAIAFALKDAGLADWTHKRDIGIIASTAYGCLHTDIEYYNTVMPRKGIGASPALFSYTLPNTFLGEAGIRFGLTGASYVVSGQSPQGLAGLQLALESIACGEAEKILCGVCNLSAPTSLEGVANVMSGAVFIMLERFSENHLSTYGPLDLDKKNCILFDRTEIADIPTLVQKCLTRYRALQVKQ